MKFSIKTTRFFPILFFCLMIGLKGLKAQQITIDTEHLAQVGLNHGSRLVSEELIYREAKAIAADIEESNNLLLRFTLAKEMVYQSLIQVNELLKDGKQAKHAAQLVAKITTNASRLTRIAGSDPQYLVFANRMIAYVTEQSIGLANEIQQVVLNPSLLMEHAQRDKLLQDITFRLRMISASLERICLTAEYAKSKGFWKSINPFNNYLARDKAIMRDIIRKAGYIKK